MVDGLSQEMARYYKTIESEIESLLVQGIPFWELTMAKGCPSPDLQDKALKHFKLVTKLPDGSERVVDEAWIFRASDLKQEE